MTTSPCRLAVVVGLVSVLTACGGNGSGDRASSTSAEPSPSISTLTPLPYPEDPPPSGRLLADMRQSSIDTSLGRMQVWIDNDTTRDVTPTRILYRDPRLGRPLVADNLRTNPAQSERGYPLYLPERPPCDEPGRPESGRLEVHLAGKVETVRVTDPTDVVGRFLTLRCDALALAELADVRWSDQVPDDGTGVGASGTLTMLIRPTGVRGQELVIETIAGSHLLNSADGQASWNPGLRVTGDDPPTRIELPLKPARCDGHAFAEGGNATAFRVSFRLDGEPGQILLRMSPEGMGNALRYAAQSCGLSTASP